MYWQFVIYFRIESRWNGSRYRRRWGQRCRYWSWWVDCTCENKHIKNEKNKSKSMILNANFNSCFPGNYIDWNLFSIHPYRCSRQERQPKSYQAGGLRLQHRYLRIRRQIHRRQIRHLQVTNLKSQILKKLQKLIWLSSKFKFIIIKSKVEPSLPPASPLRRATSNRGSASGPSRPPLPLFWFASSLALAFASFWALERNVGETKKFELITYTKRLTNLDILCRIMWFKDRFWRRIQFPGRNFMIRYRVCTFDGISIWKRL